MRKNKSIFWYINLGKLTYYGYDFVIIYVLKEEEHLILPKGLLLVSHKPIPTNQA